MRLLFCLLILTFGLVLNGCSSLGTNTARPEQSQIQSACNLIRELWLGIDKGQDPTAKLREAANIFRGLSANSDKMAEYAESASRAADNYEMYDVKVLKLDNSLYQFCGIGTKDDEEIIDSANENMEDELWKLGAPSEGECFNLSSEFAGSLTLPTNTISCKMLHNTEIWKKPIRLYSDVYPKIRYAKVDGTYQIVDGQDTEIEILKYCNWTDAQTIWFGFQDFPTATVPIVGYWLPTRSQWANGARWTVCSVGSSESWKGSAIEFSKKNSS